MSNIGYPKIVTNFGQIFLLRQYFVNLSFYFRAKLGGSAAVGQLPLFEQKHLLGDKLSPEQNLKTRISKGSQALLKKSITINKKI